jgi:hypothetical protein
MSVKFITIPLHYLTVKDWTLCKRVNIQLPHFTDNTSVECMVTGITINPNPPYICNVEFAMLDSTGLPEDPEIQDTVDALSSDNTYQDSTSLIVEQIQDVT